jgi:hypothetical protein
VFGLGLLAAHIFTNQSWPVAPPRTDPPWDASPLIPNAIPSPLPPGPGILAYGVLTALCLVVAKGIVRFLARPRLLTALQAAALLAGVGAGWSWAVSPLRWANPAGGFFPAYPDFYRGWMALERASGLSGARVAYAGTNIPYYLFGSGLRNEVRYINIDEHRDWKLHDYHRAAARAGHPLWPDYPRPGWDRAHPDYRAWLANLSVFGADLLVVTRVNPAEGPHNVADHQYFPVERRWADEHPEVFRPLHGVDPPDPWFRLYRVIPPDAGKNQTDRAARLHH